MNGEGANALTVSAVDPHSKQPELKHAAVEVERVDLPNELVALCRLGPEDWTAMECLRRLLCRFPLASLSMFGTGRACAMLRARCDRPLEPATLAELDRVLGGNLRAIRYEDPARGSSKRLWIDAGGRVAGARLAGETGAADLLKRHFQDAELAAIPPWLFLSPCPLGSAGATRGRIVCSCYDISEAQIRAEVARGADLPALQRSLKCGTNCGSCAPELRRLYAERASLTEAA